MARGTVRVKCPAQENNTMSPARAQSWTSRTNHEATTPPTCSCRQLCFFITYHTFPTIYWVGVSHWFFFCNKKVDHIFTKWKHPFPVNYGYINYQPSLKCLLAETNSWKWSLWVYTIWPSIKCYNRAWNLFERWMHVNQMYRHAPPAWRLFVTYRVATQDKTFRLPYLMSSSGVI